MIVFLHIHKTAGTTFQFILDNSFGPRHCHTTHRKKKIFDQADLDFARRVFPGLKSIGGHNLVDPLRLSIPNPFYVTILREPVARVFSDYQASVVRGHNRVGFEEALRTNERLENWHVKLMAGDSNLDKARRFLERCDFVGLTEKFDLSLHVLQRLSPHRLNLNYKKKVVAENNQIKKSLQGDPRMVELAREHNRLDLELYRFAAEEIFPRLCARAGFSPSDKVPSLDTYDSELKPRFLLSRFYNMLVYRQVCKMRPREAAAGLPA